MKNLKGFPSRYQGEATGHAGWAAAYARALPVVESGGIVLLFGKHGTGKTRMAYEICKNCEPPKSQTSVGTGYAMLKKDLPCIYTTAVNLFMDIRDTYRRDSEISEKQLMASLTSAAVLVIDEIQERGETPFEDQKLTAIIDARYMHGRPTILISNHDRRRFAETLSPAVLDRISENGLGIQFDWDSFRRGSL